MAFELRMSLLQDKFTGKPAAILGGGPSLPEDLKRVPGNAMLIAVNYHALKLVQANIMVFNDQPDDVEMQDAIQKFQGIKVSPYQEYSDILFDIPVWTGFYSSNTAAWLALWMGCDPVILCGMDCYQGERVYFHDFNEDREVYHHSLDEYLRPWKEEGKHLLPHIERLKAASGPLVGLFGQY